MSIDRARRLRKNLTDAERRLWSKLRRRQLDGFRFRRQVPLGVAADAKRTTWLEGGGFRVLRFWNNDVLANTDGVIETILRALRG